MSASASPSVSQASADRDPTDQDQDATIWFTTAAALLTEIDKVVGDILVVTDMHIPQIVFYYSSLRRDMWWWFHASSHDVEIAVLAKFDHRRRKIVLKRWEEANLLRPEATATRASTSTPVLTPVLQQNQWQQLDKSRVIQYG